MPRIKFIGEPVKVGSLAALVTFDQGEAIRTATERDDTAPGGYRRFDVVFNASARVEIEIPLWILERLARRAIENTSKRSTRGGITAKLTSGTPVYTRRERLAHEPRS